MDYYSDYLNVFYLVFRSNVTLRLEAMLHYVTTPQSLKEKLLKVWGSV